jgi:hypothetical protein
LSVTELFHVQAKNSSPWPNDTAAKATIVAVLKRKDRSVADLGLTLAEGRALLAELQSMRVPQQAASWMRRPLACHRCGAALAHKDSRSIMIRTVFGKVEVPSPRLSACSKTALSGLYSHI